MEAAFWSVCWVPHSMDWDNWPCITFCLAIDRSWGTFTYWWINALCAALFWFPQGSVHFQFREWDFPCVCLEEAALSESRRFLEWYLAKYIRNSGCNGWSPNGGGSQKVQLWQNPITCSWVPAFPSGRNSYFKKWWQICNGGGEVG